MKMQCSIEQKLTQGLTGVTHLEVLNESHNHSVPPGSESHFKVVVVCDAFEGKTSVARHQMVYRLLADEMRGGIHALALHTYTSADWQMRNATSPKSPQCLGGGKNDRTKRPEA